MASPSVPIKYLDDITECPICTEVYTDPRVLPCIHTYCLKCIEAWGKTAKSEDELACPLCRKKFDIRDGKYEDLPRNFFVEKLLEAKKLSSVLSQKEILCDLCGDDEEPLEKTAKVYCIDCQKNMCEQCQRYHTKFKTNASHKLVDAGRDFQPADFLMKYRENQCDKHPQEQVKIFCFDCKLPLCMMCFVTSHNSHKGSDVNEVAREMSNQIEDDVQMTTGKIRQFNEALNKAEERQNELNKFIIKAEKQIVGRAEEMKQWIENYKLKLLAELGAEKKKQAKQLETFRHEVEGRLLMIESFKKYSDELRTKGTACDIIRAASSLHDRAKELMQVNAEDGLDVDTDSIPTFVEFVSQRPIDQLKDVFGELKNKMFTFEVPVPRVIHKLSRGDLPYGSALLNNEWYLLYHKDEDQVEVYNTTNFSLLRRLSVPGLNDPMHMASCSHNQCLYIADRNDNKVYRVKLQGKTMTWSVGDTPGGVSVTADNNVLIACYKVRKLKEFASHGKLLRTVTLQADMVNPVLSAKLPSGQFVVGHGWGQDPVDRVCIVDTNGQVVHSYGGPRGSAAGQFNGLRDVCVDKDGRVFVVDYKNSRVVLLSPTLKFVRYVVSRDHGLSDPSTMCLDVNTRRLYIGQRGLIVVAL